MVVVVVVVVMVMVVMMMMVMMMVAVVVVVMVMVMQLEMLERAVFVSILALAAFVALLPPHISREASGDSNSQ